MLNGLLENFTVSGDRKGLLFETLVVSQIFASAKARDKKIKLSYFRTRAGYEVDLIVELEEKLFAVEIKSGQVTASDAKKLEQFKTYTKRVDGFFIIDMNSVRRQMGVVKVRSLPVFLNEVGL